MGYLRFLCGSKIFCRKVQKAQQRLEAKNFIVIEPDRADRRCKRIRLTDRARRCDEAVGQAFETLERLMCSGRWCRINDCVDVRSSARNC